jgi:hypothetical protein
VSPYFFLLQVVSLLFFRYLAAFKNGKGIWREPIYQYEQSGWQFVPNLFHFDNRYYRFLHIRSIQDGCEAFQLNHQTNSHNRPL